MGGYWILITKGVAMKDPERAACVALPKTGRWPSERAQRAPEASGFLDCRGYWQSLLMGESAHQAQGPVDPPC